ncbi:hypothetical protein BC831DRAFT_458036 [Entophlyctis helioformis]|nr:hypothetical protein BC831DRAFT_458036 [Entophlyctis helioformis]
MPSGPVSLPSGPASKHLRIAFAILAHKRPAMFIRPIDVALLPAAGTVWQDHAGNTHFVLQSKKKDGGNVMRSLFSGLSMGLGLAQQQPPQPSVPVPSATSASASGGAAATSTSGTTSAAGGIAASVAAGTSSTVDAAYRRSLLEFDFRILLRFVSRKQVFVVAVDDAFDKIHTDWNWVERNLFLKLAEIDAASLSAKPHTTPDQIDNQLLRQFEEMTEEYADPQAAGAKAKLLDIKNQLALVFPSANEDVLLNFYPCTYWVTDVISARGQLCIGRNTVYFFGTRQPGQADQDTSVPTSVAILFPYRQISVLELVTAKRALIPDSIQVGVKDKTYTFVLYFHRKEVYRILISLCDAAMNRLIKGAENSLSASHEMFSKNSSNMTGDLAIASVNKGGGLLMGRSREVNMSLGVSGMDVGDSDLGDAIGEQDFTDQAAVESPASIKLQTPHGSARGKDPHSAQHATIPAPHAAPVRDTVASASSSNTVVRYSHIKTALVNSLTDLDNQNRNLEFRNLFRLSYHETITMEESPCYYFTSPQFPASSSSATAAAAASAAATGSSVSISMLFDNAQDPNLVFVIPYSHIVSIKKQPATALPLSGKLSSFSLSGYLPRSVSDILLSRIRTVDWRFDDDVVIGGRNGMTVAGGHGASVAASPLSSPIYGDAPAATRSGSVSSLYSGAAASPAISSSTYMSTYSYDGSAASNSTSGAVGGNGSNAGGRIQTLRTGLKRSASIARWSDYFDANGRDVCIVKDMRALRDLLLRTDGVPERFRGDFWMLVSGAWYSKPETGYYEQLLLANQHRANPFAEEIEKDLHRSLPEHPAYQSPVGIDALRRLLTAFSWRNPAIGYAQALNIISAVLLLHLREDDAFWMLCMIVERMLPDHYTKTLVGSVVDQSVFKQLVRVHLPTLDAHLEKLYIDLSTFSVAIKLLDYFFLDGPKFLFWMAVGVLKVNEGKLITKGKDDDIFVAILKTFSLVWVCRTRTRLAFGHGSDISTMTGRPLYEHLIMTACTVVHQMEDTNRKSQVRTLCEQVTLSFDEVSSVYDQVRQLEFVHGEEEEDPNGHAARLTDEGRLEEDGMRATLASLGGWGLVSRYQRQTRVARPRALSAANGISGGGAAALSSAAHLHPCLRHKTPLTRASACMISAKCLACRRRPAPHARRPRLLLLLVPVQLCAAPETRAGRISSSSASVCNGRHIGHRAGIHAVGQRAWLRCRSGSHAAAFAAEVPCGCWKRQRWPKDGAQLRVEDEEVYLRAMGNNKSGDAAGGAGSSTASGSAASRKRAASSASTLSGSGGQGIRASKSTAQALLEGGDLGTQVDDDLGASDAALSLADASSKHRKPKDAETDAPFRLSFNDTFVQYFERTWSIRKEPKA